MNKVEVIINKLECNFKNDLNKLYQKNKDLLKNEKVLSIQYWNGFSSKNEFQKHLNALKLNIIKPIFLNFFHHKESDDNLLAFYEIYKNNKSFVFELLSKINYFSFVKDEEDEENNFNVLEMPVVTYERLIEYDYVNIKKTKKDNITEKHLLFSKKFFNAIINFKKNYKKKRLIEIKTTDDVLNLCCFNYCIAKNKTLNNYLKNRRIFAFINTKEFNSKSVYVISYDLETSNVFSINNILNQKYDLKDDFFDDYKKEIETLNLEYKAGVSLNKFHSCINILTLVKEIKKYGLNNDDEILDKLFFIFKHNKNIFKKIINKKVFHNLLYKLSVEGKIKDLNGLIKWGSSKSEYEGIIIPFLFKKEHIKYLNKERINKIKITQNSENEFIKKIIKLKECPSIDDSVIIKNEIIRKYFINLIINKYTDKEILLIISKKGKTARNLIINEFLKIDEKKFKKVFGLITLYEKYESYKNFCLLEQINFKLFKLNPNEYYILNELNNIPVNCLSIEKFLNSIKNNFNKKNLIFAIENSIKKILSQKTLSNIKLEAMSYILINYKEYIKNDLMKNAKFMLKIEDNNYKKTTIEHLFLGLIDENYNQKYLINNLTNLKREDLILLIYFFKSSINTKEKLKEFYDLKILNNDLYKYILYENINNEEMCKYIYYFVQQKIKDKRVLKELEYWMNINGITL